MYSTRLFIQLGVHVTLSTFVYQAQLIHSKQTKKTHPYPQKKTENKTKQNKKSSKPHLVICLILASTYCVQDLAPGNRGNEQGVLITLFSQKFFHSGL